MKIIKKYQLLQHYHEVVDDKKFLTPFISEAEYHYNYKIFQEMIFDTEDEALVEAYKINKYATWIVIPIYTFNETEEK